MAGLNLFREPFDEGTMRKLYLYRHYVEAWLPVFLHQSLDRIQIFDFFAGQGNDKDGKPGSPLIALQQIRSARDSYFKATPPPPVHLYLNEYKKCNFDHLCGVCDACEDKGNATVHYSNKDFRVVFNEWLPLMRERNVANLVFLDQNGVKFITPEVFRSITSIARTDFLFYISSSHINRFKDDPNIVGNTPVTDDDLAKMNGKNVHRIVRDAYRRILPDPSNYYLASFSIKKGGNVFGLIFGSGHPLGMEKFLNLAWKVDPLTGEADYDIDDDGIIIGQPSLFEEFNKPTKKKKFNSTFRNAVLNGDLKTTRDAYLYTLKEGFPPEEARIVVSQMMAEGLIAKRRYPISYENSYKDALKIVDIVLTDKGKGVRR